MKFLLLKIAFILVFVFVFENTTTAAFPFRNIKKGNTIPDFCVTSYDGKFSFCSNQIDKITIIIFWGADIPLKEKRSIQTLESFKNIKKELQKRDVEIITINIQNDPKEKIEAIIQKNKIPFPVYLDNDKNVYKKLGIYVIPSVLIIDNSKKIINGVGYTRKIAKITLGEIKVYRKEQSKEELKQELSPKSEKKDIQQIKAKRHLAMGQVLLKRNLTERAIGEFKKALEIKEDLLEARIFLGCSYLQLGKIKEAIKELELGLQQNDSTKGVICLAKAKAVLGKTKEAIEDLNSILLRNQKNPEIFYILGELYEKEQKFKEAAKSYKKAYLLIKSKAIEK